MNSAALRIQRGTEYRYLPFKHFPTWSSYGLPSFNTGLKIKHLVDIIGELFIKAFEIL